MTADASLNPAPPAAEAALSQAADAAVHAQLTVLAGAHFACHYALLAYPTAALAIEREWGLDYGAALALGAPMFIAFALFTPVAGWLGDGFRGDRLIACQFLGLGVAGAAVALAHDAVALQVALAAIGIFAALYHPIGLAMVTQLSRRPGRALAVNGVAGNLGLAAGAFATGVLSDAIGWRGAFLWPGLAAAMLGLWLLARPARRNAALAAAPHPVETRSDGADRAATGIRGAVPAASIVAVVLAAALFGGFAFNGVTASLPKLFEERLGALTQSLSGVGGLAALVFAVAAFAQLPVGALLDRLGARPVLIGAYGLQAAALVALAVSGGAGALPWALAAVTLMFAAIPISGWLIGRHVAAEWRARAFSVEYVLSLGAAAVVAPGMAWLHGAGVGFDIQYLAFGLGVALIAAMALWAPALRREDRSFRPDRASP